MSNPLHLICRRNNKDLNELLGRFKSNTSKQFLKEINENSKESRRNWLIKLFKEAAYKNTQYSKHHVWQYPNHPTLIYSDKLIQQKIDYIHNNLVRAGLVTEAEYYKYSRACFESPLKVSIS